MTLSRSLARVAHRAARSVDRNDELRGVLFSVKYNFALGIFIFIISKLATFTWNFTDIFVMMVKRDLDSR